MKRKSAVIVVLAVLLAAVGAWWAWQHSGFSLAQLKKAASTLNADIANLEQQVSNPPPLVGTQESANSQLTRAGVFADTNLARKQNGDLPPLKENATLDTVAEARAADMFKLQYFAHQSPDGQDAVSLATKDGYAYALIGENIALGNFADDQALLTAWMNSPGHRANILNPKYVDIGIAVVRGTYQGNRTWIAVQVFGRPLADCPSPSTTLKATIDADQAHLSQLNAQADKERADIDATPQPRTRQEADAYNQKVASYNALVDQINALIAKVKSEVATYNAQVNAFNACVST